MRIPQPLKDALDAAALENKRSLTAEVVARLEATFKNEMESSAGDDKASSLETALAVDAIAEKVAERINIPNIPVSPEILERYLAIIEKNTAARQREWWMNEFGYDPEAPRVPRHGGAPARASNVKSRKAK